MKIVIRKLLNIFETGICILAMLILIIGVIMALTNIKPVVIASGSMEPVICTGSLALIDTKYKTATKRDIIAFEAGGRLVTHRVTEVLDDGYITKGDANASPDMGTVSTKALRGRVVMWVPGIGYTIKFVASLGGITLITSFCIGILLLHMAIGKEEASNDRKENTNSIDNPVA